MLKAKSLISLFRLLLLLLLSVTLSSCSLGYLYDKDTRGYVKNIYVDAIPEVYGMQVRQELNKYFTNLNYNNAKYVLKVKTSMTNGFLLNNRNGFSTQNQITFYSNWQVVDRLSGKVLFGNSGYYNAYYNVESSSYATKNNKDTAIKLVAQATATDIALKLISLLKQSNGDLNNLKQQPTSKTSTPSIVTPDQYENIVDYNKNSDRNEQQLSNSTQITNK